MSKRYTYSRKITTPEGEETFTADQFDSFDEARRAVDAGIRDRRLMFVLKNVDIATPGPNSTGVATPGPQKDPGNTTL